MWGVGGVSLDDMSHWLGDPGWMRDAECKNEPEMPWTLDGDQLHLYEVKAMATVCGVCPVLAQCRAYADSLPRGELWGFWAGETRPGMSKQDYARYFYRDLSDHWRTRATKDGFAAAAADLADADPVDVYAARPAAVPFLDELLDLPSDTAFVETRDTGWGAA